MTQDKKWPIAEMMRQLDENIECIIDNIDKDRKVGINAEQVFCCEWNVSSIVLKDLLKRSILNVEDIKAN